MQEIPARGLPPAKYVPIVVLLMVLGALPITYFIKTAFGANGSTLQTGASAPPPVIAKAVAGLRERIARNPRDTAAYRSLAALELQAGRTAAARDILAEGLRAQPNSVDLLVAHADVTANTGDTQTALRDLNAAVAQDPRNADALYARATLAQRSGRDADAARDFAAFDRFARPDDARRAERSGSSGTQ